MFHFYKNLLTLHIKITCEYVAHNYINTVFLNLKVPKKRIGRVTLYKIEEKSITCPY